jgi:hypothetical protein
LMSTSSFGASGPGAVPAGLSKTFSNNEVMTDSITEKPPAIGPRVDDELYDLAPSMAEGDTTVALKYLSKACDALPMIAFQADVDCGPACVTDPDCGAGSICHDGTTPKACIPKVANGAAIPAGGALAGMCSVANGTRACVSGVCETSDNLCGYKLGSTCTKTSECRTQTAACQIRVLQIRESPRRMPGVPAMLGRTDR